MTMGSVAALPGRIIFDDLQAERQYDAFSVYAQSKLAHLMFAFELQRRSDVAGWGLRSVAAHPGIARTNLIPTSMDANSDAVRSWATEPERFQPAERGALPALYAATADTTPGGSCGSDGPQEMSEFPGPATIPEQAKDTGVAARLWDESVRLSRSTFA
ncbi:MAG: hypothetical protein WBB07_12885 [Mycobacterium sp.]